MRGSPLATLLVSALALGCGAPTNSSAPAKTFAPSGGLPDAASAGGMGDAVADGPAAAGDAAPLDADTGTVPDTGTATDTNSGTGTDTDTATDMDSGTATDAKPPADMTVLSDAAGADANDGTADAQDAQDTQDAQLDGANLDKGDGSAEVDAAASGDATTSDGDAPDAPDSAVPPAAGPGLVQLGAACPGWEGEPTCSNDKKWRLECVNGAWTPQQHCGFGLCKVVQSAGGAAVTTCAVPAASDPALSKACARLMGCFNPGLSHEACVRRAAEPSAVASELGVGRQLTVAEAAVLELASVANCAAAAGNCAALAQCFQYFLTPKCGSTSSSGCDGDIAWTCAGQTSPLAVNCKSLGMQCLKAGPTATCINPAPCPAGAQASTCAGQTALQCVTGGDGKAVGITSNCLETQGTCKQGVTAPASPCTGPALPCKADVPPAQCLKGPPVAVLVCSPGAQVVTTCPANTNCLLLDQFGQLGPSCPAGQVCLKGECGSGGPCSQPSKCVGSSVLFCEKGWPASFDCKDVGKTCVAATSGPRCQ